MRKVKFIQTIVVLLITIFIFNIMEPLCNTYAEINSEKENKINKLNNFSLDNFKMLDEARISRTKIETTNWKYSQTLKTSSKIKKYTLLAVTAVITTAVTYSFLGPVGSAAANGISVIAQAIISDNIPNVWITHVFYLKFMSGTYMAVGEKKVTSVYKNSARTKRIKSPVTTYYWN